MNSQNPPSEQHFPLSTFPLQSRSSSSSQHRLAPLRTQELGNDGVDMGGSVGQSEAEGRSRRSHETTDTLCNTNCPAPEEDDLRCWGFGESSLHSPAHTARVNVSESTAAEFPSLITPEYFGSDAYVRHFGAQFNTQRSYATDGGYGDLSIDSPQPHNTASTTLDGTGPSDSGAFPFSDVSSDTSGPYQEITVQEGGEWNVGTESIAFSTQSPRGTTRTGEGQTPRHGRSIPKITISDYNQHSGQTHLPHQNNAAILSKNLIKQTFDAVCNLNSTWVSRLTEMPHVYAFCPKDSPNELFRMGLQTLQQCYRGMLPTTFAQLYNLILVACAFRHIMNKGNDIVGWNDFSDDIDRWHRVILDDKELDAFHSVYHCLWKRQVDSETSQNNTAISEATWPAPDFFSTHAWSTPLMFDDPYRIRQRQDYQYETKELRTLMGGPIIEVCSEFLDAYEHLLIKERNLLHPNPSFSHERNMFIASIIGPLKQCSAFNLFPEIIMDTINELIQDRLHSIREVEVALRSHHQWSRMPSSERTIRLSHLANKCDNHGDNESNRDWRYNYYANDLSKILHLCENAPPPPQNFQSSFSEDPYTTSPTTLPGNFDVTSSSTIIANDARKESSAKPTLVAFGVKPNDNHPENDHTSVPLASSGEPMTIDPTNHSVTSADFLSDGSISPTQSMSEPSSRTNSSSTRCPHCPESFTGEPRNQRRNLRRHMFSLHNVDPRARLPCPEDGCKQTFPLGRRDNLLRHIRSQHKASI